MSVSIAAAVFIVLSLTRVMETPLERAHRVCGDCGLLEPEIDQMIENCKGTGLTPTQLIQLLKDIADPESFELCRPCAEAVVEVAG